MDDNARNCVAPCPECLDPALVQYEELQGGFVCIGCGAVLSQHMITELPSTWNESDKGTQVGGSFVNAETGAGPFLSQSARHGSRRIYNPVSDYQRRNRIHRLCQQLGLPADITDQVVNLAAASEQKGWPAEVACVYTICRGRGRDITFSDVCKAACVSRRLAGRCLRRLHSSDEESWNPNRFAKRALTLLECSFEDEKAALALLQFMRSSLSSKQPHLSAYAAVVIVASSKRTLPAISEIAEKLSVGVRSLQNRIMLTKKMLLVIGKILPLGIVMTISNVHLYFHLIIENLSLLSDLQETRNNVGEDAMLKEYQDVIAKFGPRIEPEVARSDSSSSDLESMSDGEASMYIRSEKETQDQLSLQRRLSCR